MPWKLTLELSVVPRRLISGLETFSTFSFDGLRSIAVKPVNPNPFWEVLDDCRPCPRPMCLADLLLEDRRSPSVGIRVKVVEWMLSPR